MAVPTKKEVMDFSPMNTGGAEELPKFRRNAFLELEHSLKTGLITAVTGLRRVGKTTLVKQALGKNAFYFSFDEKKYANSQALKQVVDAFISEAEKPVIFLDEIFRVEDWAGVLKKYHDQKTARFVVSGSSSLLIRKGVESLSGRLSTLYLPPLQFDEFLGLKGKKAERVSLGNAFKSASRYETELNEFLKIGSFPQIIGFSEKDAVAYIKSSTVEKIVFDDIPATFKVEHPSKLYDLMRLCAANSSNLFTEVNFAEATALSRHAVSDYLLYLEKAYLAGVIYPAGSFQKALKKQKKVFAKTACIYNALAENPSVGQAAETAVYDKLSAGKISFYRDAQQREVDFIYYNTPIEVKFQSTITSGDSNNLMHYLGKNRKNEGIMITKNLFDEKKIGGKTIKFIPLDAFLLLKI
ncbi:ATP-binding protein [Candidatus Micrarchaeota archaeon]|nr:ATP-binding protein [Candidatus Micrarchaeota archaeon]